MSDVKWDVPGWDWADGDYAWLDAGVRVDDTSIFFIHGGRIRHQAHVPFGTYSLEQFTALLYERAEGLDNPHVTWSSDTGDGDYGFWVEGTRPPHEDDLARLQKARERREHQDRVQYMTLRKAHPEWFDGATVALDQYGRPSVGTHETDGQS